MFGSLRKGPAVQPVSYSGSSASSMGSDGGDIINSSASLIASLQQEIGENKSELQRITASRKKEMDMMLLLTNKLNTRVMELNTRTDGVLADFNEKCQENRKVCLLIYAFYILLYCFCECCVLHPFYWVDCEEQL